MLVRCIYASRAKNRADHAALDSILAQSRANNSARGVTGLLCLADGAFAQVLEGGRTEVSRLMAAIMRDPRHDNIEIIQFEEIAERRFGAWTMGKIDASSVNGAIILRYSKSATFDPFSSGAATTLTLLTEIAASGSVLCRDD